MRLGPIMQGVSRWLIVCWNIVRSRNVFRGLARSREAIEGAGWSHHAIKVVTRCGIAMKWTALALGLTIVCFVGALFAIDVDGYRALIQSQSQSVLGRPLTIEGDIELDWSLSPTLAVHDVTLANVDGGSRADMARIGTLAIGLELMPLLRGELSITHLTVIDGDVILERGSDGLGNWVLSQRGERRSGEVGGLPFLKTLTLRRSRLTYVGLLDQTRVVEVDEATLFAESRDSDIAVSIAGAVQGVKVSASGRIGSVAALAARRADWPLAMTARLGTNRVAVTGTIGDPWSFSGYRLAVESTLSSLADLHRIAGRDGVDGRPGLSPVRASAVLSEASSRLSVDQLSVSIGQSAVVGALQVSVGTGRPVLTGRLSSETLVLADVLAGRGGDPARPMRLPASAIRAIDADLEWSVERMIAGDLEIRDIAAELRIQNGQLNLDVAKAVAWDGWWGGRIVADGQLSPMAVGLDITVGQLDLDAMMRHWGAEGALAGRMDGALTLHGRGDTVRALLDTANGQIALDVGEGRINNGYTDLLGRSLLSAVLPDGGEPVTHVNCAVGRFDVAEGVARSSALLVDTSRVTVGGEGAVDFGGKRLDFLLNPRTKDVNLLALVAPVRIDGAFGEIRVSLLSGDLVIDAATSVLLGVVNPFAIVIPFVTTGTGGENPCLAAIVSRDVMVPRSAPERMIGGAVDVVEGFAAGVGEAAEDLGTGITNLIDGIFGN